MKKFWHWISHIGITADIPDDEVRRIVVMNRICFSSAVVVFSFLFLVFGMDVPEAALPTILGFVMLVSNFFFVKRQWFLFSKLYLSINTIGYVIYISMLVDKRVGNHYVILIVVMLSLVLFKKKWAIALIFGLSLLAFVFISIWQSHFEPFIKPPQDALVVAYYNTGLFLITLIFLLTYYFKRVNDEYEEKILQKNTVIDQKNKEITDSIRYAKKIQAAIMPAMEQLTPLLADHFIFFQPKDIVSGDFYWIYPLPEKDLYFIAVADCTGHGVPGAMVSMVCYNKLNQAIQEFGLLQPAAILDKVNELVQATFSQGNDSVNDGMDICLCSIDFKAKKLCYAGAYNPLFVIRDGELIVMKANRFPIGKYIISGPFEQQTMDLLKGDQLYLFSDGIIDQFGGPEHKKWMQKRFKEALLKGYTQPMPEQKQSIENQFRKWQGDYEQTDDVCLMGIKI